VLWIDRWTPAQTDMDIVREDSGANFIEDSYGYCGHGVRGEVLDTGIDPDHPDVDGVIIHRPIFVGGIHGTSTYGMVFGNGDRDGDGDPRAEGHLPCLDAQGILADFQYLDNRFVHHEELKKYPYFASFQTNSWGNLTPSYDSRSFELDDIAWRLDFAVVHSMSNTGNTDANAQAWSKNVIAVGGIGHKNTLDTSDDAWVNAYAGGEASIGPAEDGRIKPDICYWNDNTFVARPGGYKETFGGTSASAPASAGVLGLMVEMWADNVWNSDPQGETVFQRQPHSSTMRALLINNAQQYPFTGQTHDLTRVHQGFGRPSARLAYERAATSLVIDEDLPLELGEISTFNVDVAGGESELKVTLVYTDPPGTTSAAMHRINDLNLKVTAPGGTIYHGNNGLLEGTASTPGGSPNDLDTVENVFIANPAAGTWTVEIHAAEVNQDAHLATAETDVVYALVVTGATGEFVQPSGGSVRLHREDFGCGKLVEIRVTDGNIVGSTVSVEIHSESESIPETVVLTQTRPGSGKFAGTIITDPGPAVEGDGLLAVSDNGLITVEYIDASDGSGGVNLLRQDTATVECHAAVISNVHVEELGNTSVIIAWNTDKAADSIAVYDETTPPQTLRTGTVDVSSHTVKLTPLEECTLYRYEVQSPDRVENPSVDDNFGDWYFFVTLGDFGEEGIHACSQGLVELDSLSYSCSDTMTISLADNDLNNNPGVVETVQVLITSTEEKNGEWLTLTEVDSDDGRFQGSIDLSTAPAAADGLLTISPGSLVTATYQDADDGQGEPAISVDTARVDCSPPAIRNVRIAEVSNTRFRVEWDSDEPSTSVVDFGLDSVLGSTVSDAALLSAHSLVIDGVNACEPLYFRVSGTDRHGHTQVADVDGSPFVANTREIGGLLFYDGFETDKGWQYEEEWQRGPPQGLSGDPTSAFSGQNVAGDDLTGLGSNPGDPEGSETLLSPVIDASAASNLELSFHRWLGTATTWSAEIHVFTPTDSLVWENPSMNAETKWSWQHYDISQWADGKASLRVSFDMIPGNLRWHNYGWNIDEVIVRDASYPEFMDCADCTGQPTFRGLNSAADEAACAAGGVALAWEEATAWGTGGGGAYDVYRSTDPIFEPSVGNQVASGISGTSWVDDGAPVDTESWYIVRARSDESCPSEGIEDPNLVRMAATETTSQPTAGSPGASLRLERAGDAHVRLSWDATSGTDHYSIHRGQARDGNDLDELATSTETLFEDEEILLNTASFFYRVVSVNTCQESTP